MKKKLELSLRIICILAVSFAISCQGSNAAFDAFESSAYTFSLVNKTEGRIRDVDILTEDGTISHPCGRMNPNDTCVKRFARKPDVLRIVYMADPVMGLGMKFDLDNVEQIWKFHRPGNGKSEIYNLILDKDYFSLTATNLSETAYRFIDGFGFNNFEDPMNLDDYAFISEYLNTTDEFIFHSGVNVDAKLLSANITPGTYKIYADDDGDPSTPVIQLGNDDSSGNMIGPGIKSGTIDYSKGQVVFSMTSEPLGEVTCSYHAPLGINEEFVDSIGPVPIDEESISHVPGSNMAWMGFYKKSDLDGIIQNIFILQRNTSGLIRGYWSFDIEQRQGFLDLKQNESGTYLLDLICTEEGYH